MLTPSKNHSLVSLVSKNTAYNLLTVESLIFPLKHYSQYMPQSFESRVSVRIFLVGVL